MPLSHTLTTMEKQEHQTLELTKEKGENSREAREKNASIGYYLSRVDAEEYRLYKRRKKLAELSARLARSVADMATGEDIQRLCERAVRLKQSAIKVPLSKVSQAKYYLTGSQVAIDCVVGGNGETLGRVKAFEARLAKRRGAKEITLRVTPSFMDCCRYGEIRKEIRLVQRAVGRIKVKVWVDKAYSPTALSRVARLCSELRVNYFCVPYYEGCEKLKLDLTGGCLLEVCGVENLEQYQKMMAAGVSRVVTSSAWEMYAEWLKEANRPPLCWEEVVHGVSEENEQETAEKNAPVSVDKLARLTPVLEENERESQS